jgi:hypothetical protein
MSGQTFADGIASTIGGLWRYGKTGPSNIGPIATRRPAGMLFCYRVESESWVFLALRCFIHVGLALAAARSCCLSLWGYLTISKDAGF